MPVEGLLQMSVVLEVPYSFVPALLQVCSAGGYHHEKALCFCLCLGIPKRSCERVSKAYESVHWKCSQFSFSVHECRGGAVQAKAEQVRVSARHTHAAWLARRFPPRVTRGFPSSRIFSHARARRRMPGDAERDARTGFFQTEASA